MQLPSGIEVNDRIGIDSELVVTEGYDTTINPPTARLGWFDDSKDRPLMCKEDQLALGQEMVRRWQLFLAQAGQL